MLLVYVMLEVGELSVEGNVRDQMITNLFGVHFGQIWLVLNLGGNRFDKKLSQGLIKPFRGFDKTFQRI